jgi:uncharacterized protein YggE
MERPTNKVKFALNLDLRFVVIGLLLIIGIMVVLWKPWTASTNANARTIQVTGETTIKAGPDQYVFNPNYQFRNKDKAGGSEAATKKSDEVVAMLKKLNVEDKDIKTNIDSYGDTYRPGNSTENMEYVYNLTVTITVNNKNQAQQVQDFLTTNGAQGNITPSASFSESTRKQLESKARDEATKDARAKAEQSAKNLGFKIGAVKTVSDGQGLGGGPILYGNSGAAEIAPSRALDTKAVAPSSSIQSGQNELPYSVTVTYYVK